MVFTPFYLSLVGFVVMFMFSYLNIAPLAYKLRVVGMVYLFTILMPTLLIRFYRHYHGWTLWELGRKEKRMVPYVLSIMCYALCYTIMETGHIPHFMTIILMAALAIQMCCAMINIWWKISTHTAAIGGVAGSLQLMPPPRISRTSSKAGYASRPIPIVPAASAATKTPPRPPLFPRRGERERSLKEKPSKKPLPLPIVERWRGSLERAPLPLLIRLNIKNNL